MTWVTKAASFAPVFFPGVAKSQRGPVLKFDLGLAETDDLDYVVAALRAILVEYMFWSASFSS